ncbi:MAG: protein kinase [Polyangiaceae bacterium]|nr:protein kinase [Polyangiaceae bacterium]
MVGGRIGGRFEIEREAGAGGMGTVYRARDAETGSPVALKIVQRCGADELERLAREARSIADVNHPGVVRYVAHGASQSGPSFLAMEWLEGEDLGVRLARSELSLADTWLLGRKVAEALAAVHARGIVHRDLKPSNLFLQGGAVDRVTIIDFGIARVDFVTRALTHTGMGLGTPGYMAPEQARGARDVDPRADIFSLGCILFECLTGRPAFMGEHPIAVLAKVLFEDAARVSDLCPDVPEPLSTLIGRMLQKEPMRRPDKAAGVAALLEAMEPWVREGSAPPRTPSRNALTQTAPQISTGIHDGEQRLVSVILVGPSAASHSLDEARASDELTLPDVGSPAQAEMALRLIASEQGAAIARLVNGTTILTIAGIGAATDRAARAARCALAVREAAPNRSIVLATGQSGRDGRGSMGDVIDRAAGLLTSITDRVEHGIRVDELTAGLLDARFQVRWEPDLFVLFGERDAEDAPRTVLGQPTTCVGRDRELRMLLDLLTECVEEPCARAVLVTGGPGVGKSRLRQELTTRVRAQDKGVDIWIARGDPGRAGAPFGLIAQVLRREARLADGEPVSDRRRKIAALVGRRVREADRARVAEFLGELVGAPFPDEGRVELRAARQDPILMGDQIRRAWVDFVQAECRSRPVLLVLEDLHWGDQSTIDYIDASLRLLRDAPLLVVALARPEVHDLFPKLWSQRGLHTIELGALSRRACERLVREVLGDGASDDLIARLWERSSGNAFFLEELLRAEAEGRSREAPDTVLAMVQSRLEGLGSAPRRILRAASVIGEVFWKGGLAALLGESTLSAGLGNSLSALENGEWLIRRSDSRFRSEVEYAFRHAFVREAAYRMLTDEDRAIYHRIAAEWLSRVGELDAAVVAIHFERGASESRAIEWYCRAAEQALEGNDLVAVIGHAMRAEVCGAQGENLGEACLLAATAHNWQGEFGEGERRAREALELLRPGSARWYDAAERLAWAVGMIGHGDQIEELVDILSTADPEPGAEASWLVAWVTAAEKLFSFVRRDRAEELLRRVEEWEARCSVRHEAALARISFVRALQALHAGRAISYLRHATESIAHNEVAGDIRNACLQRVTVGDAYIELGAYSKAEALLRRSLAEAEQMNMTMIAAYARLFLAVALKAGGELAEARALVENAADYFYATNSLQQGGYAFAVRASVLMLGGALEEAEQAARRGVELVENYPSPRTYALASLASVLLARGLIEDALRAAREATESLEKDIPVPGGQAFVWLIYAEALYAAGHFGEARSVIASARDRVLRMAPDESEPAWRASYFENVRENARTLELARAWLSEAPG